MIKSLGNLAKILFTNSQDLQQMQDEIRQQWRENECKYLGITEDDLDKLIEINHKMECAGFCGWYEYARNEIIRNNNATTLFYFSSIEITDRKD